MIGSKVMSSRNQMMTKTSMALDSRYIKPIRQRSNENSMVSSDMDNTTVRIGGGPQSSKRNLS